MIPLRLCAISNNGNEPKKRRLANDGSRERKKDKMIDARYREREKCVD